MSKEVHQKDSMSKEELYKYMTYILTGEVKDEEHAKDLQRLARTVATMSDVTVVLRVLMQQQDKTLTQLMEAVQVQQRVIQKMGAPDSLFEEAQNEYDAEIEKMREELTKQHTSVEAEKESEEDGKVQD